jgi:HNH endonuclease/AP2 domain
MATSNLTAERLREALHYAPETGIFTWRIQLSNRSATGKEAGTLNQKGYVMISVDKHTYRAHRLAFLYMTEAWPDDIVDHRDRNRANNRWENLRQATQSQNHQNQKMRKDCLHGYRGVSKHSKTGLWFVKLTVNRRSIYLGYFKTPEEACAARLAGERKYFTHAPVCETPAAYPCEHDLLGAKASPLP